VRERDHDGKLEAPSERLGRMSLQTSFNYLFRQNPKNLLS